MFKTYKTIIDTDDSGLVVKIDHQLGGHPHVFISEPTLFGDIKYLSLYDPRIASVETKGPNSIIMSFTSKFAGLITLLLVEDSLINLSEKISDLDRRQRDTILQQKNMVSNTQFERMESYLSTEISSLSSKMKELENAIKNVKSDLDNQ